MIRPGRRDRCKRRRKDIHEVRLRRFSADNRTIIKNPPRKDRNRRIAGAYRREHHKLTLRNIAVVVASPIASGIVAAVVLRIVIGLPPVIIEPAFHVPALCAQVGLSAMTITSVSWSPRR